jgi:transcriptional regulator with XRE-family HTH domain
VRDLELTMRLRNNHIKRRRLELGLSTRQLAEQAGIGYPTYLDLEGLRASPLSRFGGWTPSAKKLAEFHGVGPAVLWPDAVLLVVQPVVTREIDAEEFLALMFDDGVVTDPERLLMARETEECLRRAIEDLPTRQQEVLSRRMEGATLEEAAVGLPVTKLSGNRTRMTLTRGTVSGSRARSIETDAYCGLRNNQLLNEARTGKRPAKRMGDG